MILSITKVILNKIRVDINRSPKQGVSMAPQKKQTTDVLQTFRKIKQTCFTTHGIIKLGVILKFQNLREKVKQSTNKQANKHIDTTVRR